MPLQKCVSLLETIKSEVGYSTTFLILRRRQNSIHTSVTDTFKISKTEVEEYGFINLAKYS